MQRRLSGFNNYTIEAPDGKVGYVSDILFEDNDWKLRWFVINIGSWLRDRNLLIHPAALGRPDIRQHAFPVTRTKAEIEASPGIYSDPPVFMQKNEMREEYYTYGPMYDAGGYGSNGYGLSGGLVSNVSDGEQQVAARPGDPHLRSCTQVIGYHIQALDGDIGHLDDFLVDDETWKIEFAVVDTKNWGLAKHVLISPPQIKEIDWCGRFVRIDLTRYMIKSAPSWQEPDWGAALPS